MALKTFKQFLRLDEEAVNTSTYDLKKLYKELNVKLFNNELPEEFPITFGKVSKRSLGITKAKIIKSTRKIVPGSVEILISPLKFDENILKGIVAHEMAHAWFMLHNMPDENHGFRFLSKIRDLNHNSGFNIPLKDTHIPDSVYEGSKTKQLGLILYEFNDKIVFYLVNPKAFDAFKRDSSLELTFMAYVLGNYKSSLKTLKKVTVATGTTILSNYIPIKRTLNPLEIFKSGGYILPKENTIDDFKIDKVLFEMSAEDIKKVADDKRL